MEVKPIPAFYCCYLLRSTVRHACLYIGSTPDPRRRLAQHNGQVKGGAVRTSSVTLRPWEMTCLIAGFPSNIAALQFEWAWQNPHLTRHISHQERISFATTRTKSSPKGGRTRIRPGRPKTSLTDKLSNLHLLLRVPYFSRWPLELRFLSEDVYHLWQVWCQRVDAQIGPEIKVWLDKPRQDYEPASHVNSEGPQGRRELEVVGEGGVKGIDPTYACLRPVLEKSQMLLEEDENENLACSLCKQDINPRHDLVTICPQGNCASLHHMTCLSSLFLKAGQGSSMVPASGRCPRCKAHLSWVDLMKAMSLRVRDEKGVYKMLKSKKKVAAPSALQAAALGDDSSDEFDVGQFGDDDQLMGADIVDDDSDDDGDEEKYDAGSVTSARSDTSNSSRIRAAFRATVDTRLPTVIKDSDDDVIDLLSD